MKLQGTPRGSFGIPAEMAENVRRSQEEKATPEEKETPAPVVAEEAPEEKDLFETKSPLDLLKDVGASFSNEDFDHLLRKGFYQKEVVVVKGVKPLVAVFKTLSGKEYDEVDELLAKESKNVDMTQAGFEARRSMLILSYGVVRLNGNPVFKTGDKKYDSKTLALKKREVLNELAPGVAGNMARIHGTITMALNAIVQDPDKHLKNS